MKTKVYNFFRTKTATLFLFFWLLPALFSFKIHKEPLFPGPGPQVKKEQAQRILRRAAVVILVTHKKVKEGKIYTGNLARAITHQRFAVKLYREGKYYRAIHHARRARGLALLAFQANKGVQTAEMNFSKEEEALVKGGPSDNELDQVLAKEMPAETVKDEDAISAQPAVDLKEGE